ncbi:MAG: adenylate/guanylate cyclase domain-containing protein [candidate division WOR-3 bacterium]
MKCPNCGKDVPSGNKFCGECGFNLISYTSIQRMDLLKKTIPESLVKKIISIRDTATKERRNVTVVFADISGFTPLSEKLDPEELTFIMNECFRRLGMMVYRYEGIIDKFIGDCIMAIFGAPVSHEDDPERAILSSLDMQTALEEINEQFAGKFAKLEIHTGINTGEVIAGKIGSDLQMEYTVMGDTVNVAQRLKDIAKPGTILVGPETYQRTKHAFDFIKLDAIKLKGKEEKIIPFEVVGKKWGAEYGLGPFRSRLVGREHELDKLKSAIKNIKEKSWIFIIKGEIGVGKSRLLYELKKFVAVSAPEVILFDGRGVSYESLIPYKTFADSLRNYFIPVALETDRVKEVVADKLKSILNTEYEETAAYILKLLNLKLNEEEEKKIIYLDTHSLQLQILLAVAILFEKISLNNPIVLIIDDIQWLDSGSLEIINFLLPILKKSKVVFCLSYRTGETKEIKNFLNRIATEYSEIVEEIKLDNLSYEASLILINNLLGEDVEEALKKDIFLRSNGNPFFIEEICHQIIELGVLNKDIGIDLDKIQLPGSIETVVTARTDLLSKEAQYLLKIASIIGRSFPEELLKEIIKEKELLKHLDELENAELLVHVNQGNVFYYTFRHPIFQEVTYRSLLRSERMIYHKIIADAIESKFLGILEGSASLLAYHYFNCEEFSKASEYAIKAGDEAIALFATAEAIKNYQLAIDIAEDEDKRREGLEKLADVKFIKLTEIDEILNLYEQAKRLTKDKLIKARIDRKVGMVYARTGQLEKGIEIMSQALKDIENEESSIIPQLAYQLADLLLEVKSETERAEELIDYGIKIARRIKDQKGEILGLQRKAQVLWRRNLIEEALKNLFDIEHFFEKTEDLPTKVSYFLLKGAVYRSAGNQSAAMECYRRSNELSEKMGDQRSLALGYNNLGICYELMGDLKTGLAYYEKSLEIKNKLRDERGGAIGYFNIGTLKSRVGEFDKAREFYEHALKISQKINEVRVTANSLLAIANILIETEDFPNALQYLKSIEELARQKNEEWMNCEILCHYSRYFLKLGDIKRARECITKVLELSASKNFKLLSAHHFNVLAEICLEENNSQAIQYAQKSLELAQESQVQYEQVSALIILGRAQALLINNSIAGIKNINKAISIAEEFGLRCLQADGYFALAEIMALEGKNKPAINYLRQAKTVYSELQHKVKMKKVDEFLSKIED